MVSLILLLRSWGTQLIQLTPLLENTPTEAVTLNLLDDTGIIDPPAPAVPCTAPPGRWLAASAPTAPPTAVPIYPSDHSTSSQLQLRPQLPTCPRTSHSHLDLSHPFMSNILLG